MLGEALAAYAHYLSILVTGCILAGELFLYRRELTVEQARRLMRLDIAYPVGALCILASGLARLLWFAKGPEFYLPNPVFWIKMALFAFIALLSIPPTVHYLRWRPDVKAGRAPTIAPKAYRHVHMHLGLEMALFLLMPLLAALMARGIGR